MATKLSSQDVTEQLAILNENTANGVNWELSGDKITKTFKFDDFTAAFAWMSAGAICAEKLNHHPEWFNVYNRVEVELTTHDVNGISELDFKLAGLMEKHAK